MEEQEFKFILKKNGYYKIKTMYSKQGETKFVWVYKGHAEINDFSKRRGRIEAGFEDILRQLDIEP